MQIISNVKFWKVLSIFSLVLFLTCVIQRAEYSPDDTFIYLKYAENLSVGDNFSFNAGEPSYGITSPLWAIMLMIPFIINTDPFWFSKSLDLLFILLSFYIFYRLTEYFFKDNTILRFLALIIFIINPWIIRTSFTGMETSLAVFAVLLIFLCYYTGKFRLMFIVSGLSVLIRPELIFLNLILLLFVFIYQRSGIKNFQLEFVKYLSILFFTIVPFWIFAYFTFGTIVSNTSLGKSLLTFDFNKIISFGSDTLRVFVLLSPIEAVLAMFASLFVIIKRKQVFMYPVLTWIAVLLAVYFLTSASVMARYFMITYPFIVLIAVKFLEFLPMRKGFLTMIVFLICITYSQYIFYSYVKPYSLGFSKGINECLIPASKWINQNTNEGSRILASDVGVIGFYSDRYVIDGAALINNDLELNRSILQKPAEVRERLHLLLDSIETDYLVERDSVAAPLRSSFGYDLEPLEVFTFQRLTVLDPRPKYYTIYKVTKKKW